MKKHSHNSLSTFCAITSVITFIILPFVLVPEDFSQATVTVILSLIILSLGLISSVYTSKNTSREIRVGEEFEILSIISGEEGGSFVVYKYYDSNYDGILATFFAKSGNLPGGWIYDKDYEGKIYVKTNTGDYLSKKRGTK